MVRKLRIKLNFLIKFGLILFFCGFNLFGFPVLKSPCSGLAQEIIDSWPRRKPTLVSGVVSDRLSHLPISKALVKLYRLNCNNCETQTSTTNEEGMYGFSIGFFRQSRFCIEVAHPNYVPQTIRPFLFPGYTYNFNITLTPIHSNRAPILAPIGNKTINEGNHLHFRISATDPDKDTLTYRASNLPHGARFISLLRDFFWTPKSNQVGTYPNVVFEVSDGMLSDSEEITITVNAPPILSISLDPKSWDIGSTEVNKVVTMTPAHKITVTNNGTAPETFELKLINPPGWTASTSPGQEIYVLSGIFCGTNDAPLSNHFNQNRLSEDVISTKTKKATADIFAYRQARANGVAVPAGNKRSLYLQFKSPRITQKKEEQDIGVIVSCQAK